MPTISVRATITAVAVIVVVVAFAAVRGQIGQPVVAAATPSAPTASASETGTATRSAQPSPTRTPRPTHSPSPSPTFVPTPVPTPVPMPISVVTAAPVVTLAPPPPPPAAPTPLPWYEPEGGAGAWDVPFEGIPAGSTGTIRFWNLPAPALCAMQAVYPGGSALDLGAVTAVLGGRILGTPAAYEANFPLPVTADALLGDGSLTVQCSYLGVERINTFFSFRVIAAP